MKTEEKIITYCSKVLIIIMPLAFVIDFFNIGGSSNGSETEIGNAYMWLIVNLIVFPGSILFLIYSFIKRKSIDKPFSKYGPKPLLVNFGYCFLYIGLSIIIY